MEKELKNRREQEKRSHVYLFFRKVNKNFAGPARAANERTVDDGRAKCSWPTGQNEFVSIITLHPAVIHEPARGPVILALPSALPMFATRYSNSSIPTNSPLGECFYVSRRRSSDSFVRCDGNRPSGLVIAY